MVSVVGAPTKGQFGQIAGADNKPSDLIGQIHQNLRTLTGLGIFKHNVEL